MSCLPGSVSNPVSRTDLFPLSSGPPHPPKHTLTTHRGILTVNVYTPTHAIHRRRLCPTQKCPVNPGGHNPPGECNNNRQLTESIHSNRFVCVRLSVSVALSCTFTKNISDCYFGCMHSMGTIIYCVWVYNYVILFLFKKSCNTSQHRAELK